MLHRAVVHSDTESQNVLFSRSWDLAKIAYAGVAQ